MFLLAKLDKDTKEFKKSRGGEVSHQGLILIIFKHIVMQMGVSDAFKWLTMGEGKEE